MTHNTPACIMHAYVRARARACVCVCVLCVCVCVYVCVCRGNEACTLYLFFVCSEDCTLCSLCPLSLCGTQ